MVRAPLRRISVQKIVHVCTVDFDVLSFKSQNSAHVRIKFALLIDLSDEYINLEISVFSTVSRL